MRAPFRRQVRAAYDGRRGGSIAAGLRVRYWSLNLLHLLPVSALFGADLNRLGRVVLLRPVECTIRARRQCEWPGATEAVIIITGSVTARPETFDELRALCRRTHAALAARARVSVARGARRCGGSAAAVLLRDVAGSRGGRDALRRAGVRRVRAGGVGAGGVQTRMRCTRLRPSHSPGHGVNGKTPSFRWAPAATPVARSVWFLRTRRDSGRSAAPSH